MTAAAAALAAAVSATAVDFYMYAEAPASLAAYRGELADQKAHGMTMAFVPDPVSRQGALDREALEGYLDAYRDAAFPRGRVRMDLWNRITAEWLNEPDRGIGMWGPWFRYYRFSTALDRRYVATVAFVRNACARRGLTLVLGVADEPGSHPWTIAATRHYLALIRRSVPGVRLDLTVGGGWASGEREEALWRGALDSWTTNRWLPGQLAAVRRENPGAELHLYNMAGKGSAPGGVTGARMAFGFYAWKARAQGVAQWVYHHAATPEENYVRPVPGGAPSPTPRWEAVREGTEDYRTMARLEAKLAGASGASADEARAFLKEVDAAVELRNVDDDPVSGGRVPAPSREVMDRWRARALDLSARL